MRILITTSMVPFVYGGAEYHAKNLKKALCQAGHEAEIIAIPFKWYPAMRIPEQMLACQLLDITNFNGVPIDLVIGLKFPAYLIPHPNKVLWILHQHRAAYDMWGNPMEDLNYHPNAAAVRYAIMKVDSEVIPQAKRVYTNSNNVSQRLKKYNDVDSVPLYHPPPGAELLYCEDAEDYLFFPSRLSASKRQLLVIEALALTKEKVKVRFSGTPDMPATFEELKKIAYEKSVADRITWLGEITEEEKLRQFARSLAIIYPPLDEDLGYVPLEAMLASKPVITCTDSGGPLEFTLHRETGLVSEPTPAALAEAMDEIWQSRITAKQWGINGHSFYESKQISWTNVIEHLLA